MTLEEEKKLVAEKLMGWKLDIYIKKGKYYCDFITDIGSSDQGLRLKVNEWNPQSERKWWDEIWDKMDEDTFQGYMSNLADFLIKPERYIAARLYHTAKPETCWKALLKTLGLLTKS